MSGPGKFPRVESNSAAGSTPGGALPSIPLSFSLATTLPPESRLSALVTGFTRVLPLHTPGIVNMPVQPLFCKDEELVRAAA